MIGGVGGRCHDMLALNLGKYVFEILVKSINEERIA
jgi:hypothetical protein